MQLTSVEDHRSAPRRRWRLRRPGWGTLVVLAATALAMTWMYVSHHQIFPDTQYYLAWTYRLLGYGPYTAERMVLDYIRDNAVFEPYPYIWASPVAVPSTRARLLLPVLSTPFVAAFGPGGIVVVPGIAFVAAMYFMYRFAALHASVRGAVVASVLALLSPLVVVWNVGGLTDSLALMLHAAMFLLLPWRAPVTRYTLVGIAAVCALTATARIITPYTATAMAGLWLWAMLRGDRALRRSWTAATVAAAVGALVGVVWMRVATAPVTTMMLLRATSNNQIRDSSDILPWYAENLPDRLLAEGRVIWTSPVLLALILLSLVACVTARRTVVPWLVIPAWIGAFGVFLINPAVTVFRYELQVLPATIVAVAVLVEQVLRRWSVGRGLNVEGQRGDEHVDAGEQRSDAQEHAAGGGHRRA